MRNSRWWLALIADLLTPWIGPHVDRYLPVGWVLFRAGAETADAGFWVIAGAVLALGYAAWFVLLTGIVAGLAHLRHRRGKSRGHA